MENKIYFTAIGSYHSDQKNPYEAGRQPDEFHAPGFIELSKGQNFEQALIGLEKFSHLWVIFQFHHNENWKPMTSPPRGSTGKVGVFASRAPYRPNNIGISAVRLEKVNGLKIYVTEADILDGSPILDIKPYLSYADSKPDASSGWILETDKFSIGNSEQAKRQLQWLRPQLNQLESFVQHQLEFEPLNYKKKRIKANDADYTLAYRTWRVDFSLVDKTIEILRVYSGYTKEELEKKEDPYFDKDLHRRFNSWMDLNT